MHIKYRRGLGRAVACTLTAMTLTLLDPIDAASAADTAKINARTTQEIDAFGTCRKVRNGGSDPIMVPLKTSQQWSSGSGAFLNNIGDMQSVSVSPCRDWWDGRGKSRTGLFGTTRTLMYWRDGSDSYIIDIGVKLRPATRYDASTGSCAPGKSFIASGGAFGITGAPTIGMGGSLFGYIQLCDSDGIATPPMPYYPAPTFNDATDNPKKPRRVTPEYCDGPNAPWCPAPSMANR